MTEVYDTVVVGGGVSGVYSAYRLSEIEQDKKMCILEAQNKKGGRLDSDLVKIGKELVREEQGGMRFDSSMRSTLGLLTKLEMLKKECVVPFAMNRDLFYYRALNFRGDEEPDTWKKLWTLNTTECAFPDCSKCCEDAKPYVNSDTMQWHSECKLASPGKIMMQVLYRVTTYNMQFFQDLSDKDPNVWAKKGTKPISPEQWQFFRLNLKWPYNSDVKSKNEENTTLNCYTFTSLLRVMGYTFECIEMMTNSNGFRMPFQGNGNAGDAFQLLLDFPQDPSYFTLRLGLSQIVAEMSNSLCTKNILLKKNHTVSKIDTDDGCYSLTVMVDEGEEAVKNKERVPHLFRICQQVKVIKAKRVILAIPQEAIRNIYCRSSCMWQMDENNGGKFLPNINSVAALNLSKINLFFENAWWFQTLRKPEVVEGKAVKMHGGPFFTDMHINSIYAFYSLGECQTDKPTDKKVVKAYHVDPNWPQCSPEAGNHCGALTVYCDWNNARFWEGLQSVGSKFTPRLDPSMPRAVFMSKQSPLFQSPSQAVVNEILSQLKILMKGTQLKIDIPQPVNASYRSWNGTMGFPVAVYMWTNGCKDDEVIKYMVQPFQGEQIYTCGECYSDQHGWINGALRSADTMLETIVGGAFKRIDSEFKYESAEVNALDGISTGDIKSLYPQDKKNICPCEIKTNDAKQTS